VPPLDTAAATALGLALAVASFLTSLVVAGRDRAHLRIRVGRGLTTPALEEALVVEVANAGRRPLGLDPVDQRRLEGAGGRGTTAIRTWPTVAGRLSCFAAWRPARISPRPQPPYTRSPTARRSGGGSKARSVSMPSW
jgi:hypothetical protein